MQLIRYFSADSMLERVEKVLIKNEVANNLILGVLYSITDDYNKYGTDPYLAVVEDSTNIIAIAVMTPPYNLLIYSENIDTNAYTMIVRELIKSDYSVPGVNGIKNMSFAFAETWSFENASKVCEGMGTMAFKLDKVIVPDNVNGELKQANIRHYEMLCSWMRSFTRDAHLQDNPEHLVRNIQKWIDREKIFLWIVDGKPVSMAIRTRELINGEAVSGVYTPDKYRNHGYASAVTAGVSQAILDSGKEFACLFTDMSNPVSNSIYQKIGYKKVCEYREYKF